MLICSMLVRFVWLLTWLFCSKFWKELWKEGIRCKGSENPGACVRPVVDDEKSDLRPHSSMAHYEATPQQTALPRPMKHVNESPIVMSKNNALREAIEGRVEGGLIKPPSGVNSTVTIQGEAANSLSISATSIRSHHSRLDKSQSTPAYESIVANESSQERKSKELFFQRQNRLEEESEPQPEQKPFRDLSK